MSEIEPSFLRKKWKPIVFGTLLLPICFAGMGSFTTKFIPSDTMASSCLAATSLIVQLGIAAWFVSKLDLPTWMRNAVYLWCLTLIDVNVFVATCQSATFSLGIAGRFAIMLPAAALFAGQIGGISAFAVLGRGMWIVRILYCSVAVWSIWCVWRFCSSGWSPWNNVIILQTLAVFLLCVLLRFAGFRFSNGRSLSSSASQQFSILHVVLVTTCVAVLVAMAQAGAPLLSNSLPSLNVRYTLLAISAAVCMGVALWAALGKEPPVRRLLLFVVVACVCGILFGLESKRFLAIPNPWATSRDWYFLARVGMWWVAWFLIAPAILSSVLLYVRLSGWQLGYTRKVR